MSKDQSVAPKERVNITYKSATGDVAEDVELPFRTLVLGNFTGRASDELIEERKPVAIDKDNFDDVLRENDVKLELNVADHLSGREGGELPVQISIRSMKDFEPEQLASQVPVMKQLLELRAALTALKGPMSNVPGFRKRLASSIADPGARTKLLAELGLHKPEGQSGE
jgi:type VI secretion system protein ImpB